MFTYNCKIIRVVDGDTVEVNIDLGFSICIKTSVRIAGIDAPETRTRDLTEKSYGMRAKAIVEKWFEENNNLIIRTEKEDKYGRYLGYFYSGEICLNEYLLDNRYVWQYNGGTKVKDFSELSPIV
jgi:micrococcal nuclease